MKIPAVATISSSRGGSLQGEVLPLSTLKAGEKALIVRIDHADLELALLKIGVTKGDPLTFSTTAPLGGPVVVRSTHTKLTLRREDAQHIWISRL